MKVDMDADVVVDEVANMLTNMEVDICTRWPTWWPTSRGWLIGPKLFDPNLYTRLAHLLSFATLFYIVLRFARIFCGLRKIWGITNSKHAANITWWDDKQ